MMNEKIDILGSQISVWNLRETADHVQSLAKDSRAHYICVSNVHTVVTGMQDPSFAQVTNQATLATADGVPLVWASKLLNGPKIHGRASGPDILQLMLHDPAYAGLRHYFYGSMPAVLEKLEKSLIAANPKFQIAGMLSPPMRKAKRPDETLDQEELAECAKIAATNPDVIWVGLGAPKQEIWMHRAHRQFKRGVFLGVGAAFDFLSGNKSRAPLWMQKSGLEWAHRLLTEPRRLTGRYLETNPVFVMSVIRQAISGRAKGR